MSQQLQQSGGTDVGGAGEPVGTQALVFLHRAVVPPHLRVLGYMERLDVEREAETAEACDVLQVPDLRLYQDGIEVDAIRGSFSHADVMMMLGPRLPPKRRR